MLANGLCEKTDVGGYVPAVFLPGRASPTGGALLNVGHFANAEAMFGPDGPGRLVSWLQQPCARRFIAAGGPPGKKFDFFNILPFVNKEEQPSGGVAPTGPVRDIAAASTAAFLFGQVAAGAFAHATTYGKPAAAIVITAMSTALSAPFNATDAALELASILLVLAGGTEKRSITQYNGDLMVGSGAGARVYFSGGKAATSSAWRTRQSPSTRGPRRRRTWRTCPRSSARTLRTRCGCRTRSRCAAPWSSCASPRRACRWRRRSPRA